MILSPGLKCIRRDAEAASASGGRLFPTAIDFGKLS
jgi:hypothetical protein